ncbi:LysM domain/BON superfamily protein [Posidoniimonas polymericola]|uniref:LysM domain/BON superfamily protein n=1 Tax=Posidoniimonas polymericola TaxID=2528002 RepID=A0A5C5YTA0_9BACT|nr:hypothetical protein [Posidoniimonas polymericola]TWT78031.1 LysM domain/BON superfamily protein [Posidoniimonas polymericola]
MTSITKTAFALLLLACGFIAAKTFGPPDLAKRLVDSWTPATQPAYGELRPAMVDKHQADFLPPLEMMNPPAGFAATATAPAASAPPAAQGNSGWQANSWAAPTLAAAPASPPPGAAPVASGGWDARSADPALLPSSFEEEMAPLRPAGQPSPTPTAWQTPATQTLDPTWGAEAATPARGSLDQWPMPASPPGPQLPTPPAFDAPTLEPPAQWAAPSTMPVREVSQPQPLADPWAGPAVASSSAWRAEPVAELTPLAPPSQWEDPQTHARTHVVTDGDSLPRLAERYLGDTARSTEIYELNREQLTHPELLPLGLELRLPR